jgi:hypothetical protein
MRRILRNIINFLLTILGSFLRNIVNFLCTILKFIKEYNAVFSLLLTAVLVLVTFWHMQEAEQMRKETARMVDLSVEQFRIKHYPTFQVIAEKMIIAGSDKIFQKFTITNKGDITAFKVSPLFVNAYAHNLVKGKHFRIIFGSVYEFEGQKTPNDVEIDVLKESPMHFDCHPDYPPGLTFDNLKNALLFIRFKVPYDTKYSYSSYGFSLQKAIEGVALPGQSYRWIRMDARDTNNLIKEFMQSAMTLEKISKGYFVDYDIR